MLNDGPPSPGTGSPGCTDSLGIPVWWDKWKSVINCFVPLLRQVNSPMIIMTNSGRQRSTNIEKTESAQ